MTTPKLIFIDCSLIDSTGGTSSGRDYNYNSEYYTTTTNTVSTYVKNFFKNAVQSELSGIPTEIWNNKITSVANEKSAFTENTSIPSDATDKLRAFVNNLNALPDNSSVWMNMYGRTRPNSYQNTVTYPDSNPNSILIDLCHHGGANIIINSEIFRKVLQYIKPSIRIFISIDAWFGASLGLLKFLYNGTNTLEPYIHNPNAGFPRVYADVIVLASSSIHDYQTTNSTQTSTTPYNYKYYYKMYYDGLGPDKKTSKFNKYLFTDTSDSTTPNTYYTGDTDSSIPFFTYALVQSFNYLLVTTKRVPTVFNLYFEILNFYNSFKSTAPSARSDLRYYINNGGTDEKLKAYPVIVSERAVDFNKYVLDIYNSDSTVDTPSEGMILPSVINLVPNSYEDNDPKKTLVNSIDLDNIYAIRAVPDENNPSKDEKAFVKDDMLLFRFVVYYELTAGVTWRGFKSSLTNWEFEDSLFDELVEDYNNLFDPDIDIDTDTTRISGTTVENLQNMCYSSMKELYDTLNRLKPGYDKWWVDVDVVKQMKSLKLYKLTLLSAIKSTTGIQFFQFDPTVPVLSTDKAWLNTDYAKQPFFVDSSTSMFTLFRTNQNRNTNYTIEDVQFNLNANLNEIILNSNNLFDVQNSLITTITDIQITLDGAPYTALNVVENYPALNAYILPTDKIPQYNSGIKSLGWTVCDLNTYDDNIYYNYLFKISLNTSEYINKKIIKELYLDCDLYPPKGAPFPLEIVSLINHYDRSPYASMPTRADVLYFHNAGSNTFLSNNFYFSNINNGNYISSSNTDLFLMALEHPVSNQFSPIQNSTADFRVTVTNMSNVFFDLDTQTEYFQQNLDFNIHMIGRISNHDDGSYYTNITNMIESAKYSTTKYLDPEKIENIDFSKHVLKFHDKIIDEADLYFDQQKIPFENFDSADRQDHGSIEVSENVISSARFDVSTSTTLSSETTEFNNSITTAGKYDNLFDKLRSYFTTYSTASLYDEGNTQLINIDNEVLFSNCSATDELETKVEDIIGAGGGSVSMLSDSYTNVYIKSLAVQKLLSICSGAETSPSLNSGPQTFIDGLQTYIELVNQEIDRIATPFNLYKNMTSTQNQFVTNTILVKALDIYVNELTNSVEVDSAVTVDITTYNGTQSITDTNNNIVERYSQIKFLLGKADASTLFNLTTDNADHIDDDVIGAFNSGKIILDPSNVDSFDTSNFLKSYKEFQLTISNVEDFEVIKYHHRLTVPVDMDTNNFLINTNNKSNLFAQYTIRSMGLNKSNLINFYKAYQRYAGSINVDSTTGSDPSLNYSNVSDAETAFNGLPYPPTSESNQYFSDHSIESFNPRATPTNNVYSRANSHISNINTNIENYGTTIVGDVDTLTFSDLTDKTIYLRNQLKMMYHIHSDSNIQSNLNKISMVIWQYNVYMDAYTQLSSNVSDIASFQFTTEPIYDSTVTDAVTGAVTNLSDYFGSIPEDHTVSDVRSNYSNNLYNYFSNITNAMKSDYDDGTTQKKSIIYHFSNNTKYFATDLIRGSLNNVYDSASVSTTIYDKLNNYTNAINAANTASESASNWQYYKSTFDSSSTPSSSAVYTEVSVYASNAINYYAKTSNQYTAFKSNMNTIYSTLSNNYSTTYDTAVSKTSSANGIVTCITDQNPIYTALNGINIFFTHVTSATTNVNRAYTNYTDGGTGTSSNDNYNMSNQLNNLITAQSIYIDRLNAIIATNSALGAGIDPILDSFSNASNANLHAKNVFEALNITNAIRVNDGISSSNGVDSTSITIDAANMSNNLISLSTTLSFLTTSPLDSSNPYLNAQNAITTIRSPADTALILPHSYDFQTAESDYKTALKNIGQWATSFRVDVGSTTIDLTDINDFQTKMYAHHTDSSNISGDISKEITNNGGAAITRSTPFNDYIYDSTESATMNTQISRIQSLFRSFTSGKYSSYQMLVESSTSDLYNYLNSNATSHTGTIDNIYIKFDFFNSNPNIPFNTYHALYTAAATSSYEQLNSTNPTNPFEIGTTGKDATSLLEELDTVYQEMEMIEKVAKWARLSQTVGIMQEICSENNPPVPTDFTANSASSLLPTETSKYIMSVFDLPISGASSLFEPSIKDFDFRLEFSNDISFYPLSNLFETPMNTFSDLYSVKSNDCLFMSWTNDRELFPISSNEYKSSLYSNMLLNIPFTKNIAGTLLSINTGLKINDAPVATKSVAVSNLNLISTNDELTTYFDKLRMESGFVDTNMSNTQQFQFKADIDFKLNDGTTTDIYQPISNITAESFKFPYYKCYTIPTTYETSSSLAKDDLQITFHGNDQIVFNSNCDMLWYNSDIYRSLLVLTETSNNLSLENRDSGNFIRNQKSNLFYLAGIPQGQTIKTVFDLESCTQANYLHMEQTIVTMCNLRYFNSNHSRVPPWTAHDIFLYMSREGFSNIVFNNTFDLNTDLYDDPTTEENLPNYDRMPFNNENNSNIYMWYSNSAGNNLNLSFELSNSGSKTYNNYDGCKFYDMRSYPKVNHIAIATNDTNKVRVNMNVDYDTTSDLSNVFLHMNYPNTGGEYFNNDQYIYVFENSNNSIYVNIDSNTSDGDSKIGSLNDYAIVDPTPITLNFDSVYRLTKAASTPFEYNPSFNNTDAIDLNYKHTSKIFRAYGFSNSTTIASKFFEVQFELTNTRPERNLKFSTKPVRNYQNYLQVDQRVEVQDTKEVLFVRFYRPDSNIDTLYFSICIETTMIPIEQNYIQMGRLIYNYASYTLNTKEFLESDTFPYATDLY